MLSRSRSTAAAWMLRGHGQCLKAAMLRASISTIWTSPLAGALAPGGARVRQRLVEAVAGVGGEQDEADEAGEQQRQQAASAPARR